MEYCTKFFMFFRFITNGDVQMVSQSYKRRILNKNIKYYTITCDNPANTFVIVSKAMCYVWVGDWEQVLPATCLAVRARTAARYDNIMHVSVH